MVVTPSKSYALLSPEQGVPVVWVRGLFRSPRWGAPLQHSSSFAKPAAARGSLDRTQIYCRLCRDIKSSQLELHPF